MAFTVAERKNAKLRLAVSGPAGSGKTYSSLLLAGEFGKRVALIDSERNSALKYAGEQGFPQFAHDNLADKTPQEYIDKIKEAADAGFDALVIDSFSHSWISALEIVDKMGGSKFNNGWKVVSPLYTRLTDTILNYPGHVIATMRSKTEYVNETINGKAVPRKVGMAPVARDGIDYEFDVFLDLSLEGGIRVSKSRCSALIDGAFTRNDIGKIAKILKGWLAGGASVSPKDIMIERIQFAQNEAELQALIPDLKQLPKEDLAAVKPIYDARKAVFGEV